MAQVIYKLIIHPHQIKKKNFLNREIEWKEGEKVVTWYSSQSRSTSLKTKVKLSQNSTVAMSLSKAIHNCNLKRPRIGR